VDEAGQRFIVEMQRAMQFFYKERALYDITFPLTQQAQKGEQYRFDLLPIYSLNILDCRMDDDPRYWRRVQLSDSDTGQVFYHKLTFVYVELPKFQKSAGELSTPTEKWVYLLRHMPELTDMPKELDETPFTQVFGLAEHARLSETEQYYYEGSLKQQRDQSNALHTARIERSQEIARSMLAKGMDLRLISELTGLSADELAMQAT
jgi:predicted transposase/invertase (TIGR01784 family)